MNELIQMEVRFFLTCILWGIILLAVYDMLRIFRRIIRHGKILLSLEDILFWIISGILIFKMMYKQNNGIIRGFAILGMGIGMLFYNRLFSGHIVKGISFVIIKIIKVFKKTIGFLLRPAKYIFLKIRIFFGFVWKNIKKLIQTFRKRLKKLFKTVKMILIKQ